MKTIQVSTQINVDIKTVWQELAALDRYTDWLSEDCYVFPPLSITRRGDYTWLFEYQNGYQVWEVISDALGSMIEFQLRDYDLPVELRYHVNRFDIGEYDDGSAYVTWSSRFELDQLGTIQKFIMEREIKTHYEAFIYLSLRRLKYMLEDRKNADIGVIQVAEESTAAIEALSGDAVALPSGV